MPTLSETGLLPDEIVKAIQEFQAVERVFSMACCDDDGSGAIDYTSELLGVAYEALNAAILAELNSRAPSHAALLAVLREIASQKTTHELEQEDLYGDADIEGGWDAAIERARAALTAQGEGK